MPVEEYTVLDGKNTTHITVSTPHGDVKVDWDNNGIEVHWRNEATPRDRLIYLEREMDDE
jgi:hypothetical protein